VVKRFEKKNESSPNQGEKVLRPEEGQDKKEETSSDEGKIPAVGTTDRLDPPFGEETIRFQEFHSFKKSWQYGCIADGIASPPLDYVLGYQNIVPVVQNQIEQFKDEPETDRPGKKKEKLPGMAVLYAYKQVRLQAGCKATRLKEKTNTALPLYRQKGELGQ